jgi:hypothetical protein
LTVPSICTFQFAKRCLIAYLAIEDSARKSFRWQPIKSIAEGMLISPADTWRGYNSVALHA